MEPTPAPRESASSAADAADSHDLPRAFLGPKNPDYYLARFDRFERSGGALSWHWPAFFVTWGWLAYRKMWAWFFVYWLLFPLVIGVVSVFLGIISPVLGGVVYLSGFFVVPALFANRLYHAHAVAKMNRARQSSADPRQQALEAARLGGTSAIGVFIVVISVMVVPVAILAGIAVPAYQDYTVRAQVYEGLAQAAPMKLAVSEYYLENGHLPRDAADVGLPVESPAGGGLGRLRIDQGDIILVFGGEVQDAIAGKQLRLSPDVGQGIIEWGCSSPDLRNVHLPASCR